MALLPEDAFSIAVIELLRRAREFIEISPILSLTNNRPHISLVQGDFDGEVNFSELLHEVAQRWLVSGCASLLGTQIMHQSRGWVFQELSKTSEIQALLTKIPDLATIHLLPPHPLSAGKMEGGTPNKRSVITLSMATGICTTAFIPT